MEIIKIIENEKEENKTDDNQINKNNKFKPKESKNRDQNNKRKENKKVLQQIGNSGSHLQCAIIYKKVKINDNKSHNIINNNK